MTLDKSTIGKEKAISKLLMATGAVAFAEPDASIAPTIEPNDSDFSSQWHHQTIGSPLAWNNITAPTDLSAVRVCVLDTGVDTDHPDLAANLVLPGYNAPLQQAGSVEDAHGHGTGTAGVIGAVGNNGIGVSGMVWDIDILPVQINISNTNSSAYISDMAVGISWCADQGAKVANLSYGGAQYATISDAAQYLRDRGGLLFMSAGNSGTFHDTTAFPDYSSFVIVGATNQSDTKSSFSEYGPYIDLTAPGESIRTTYINASYISYSGTSFSSPLTAGLGALVYAVNPSFTPQEVENILFSTAKDIGVAGDDDTYGHGRIDANAAIVAALNYVVTPNEPPVVNATATPISGIAPLDVLFDGSTSTDDGSIVTYAWNFGDGSSTNDINPAHTYMNAGTYSATLTLTDNLGLQTTSSAITITVNPDPSVLVAPSNLSASVNTNNITLAWSDNSGNETGFVIERAKKRKGKFNFSTVATTASDISTFTDTVTQTGNYRYRVKAINDATSTTYTNTLTVTVDTIGNTPDPEPGTLVAPVLSQSVNGKTVTLLLSHTCPDGETCSYSIERGDSKVKGQINFSPYARSDSSLLTESITELRGTYYYRVKANTVSEASDFSNVVSTRIR